MFEDQIEQLKELFQGLKERVQESSLYLTLYERFSSLSPKMQKLTIIGFSGLLVFLLISPPLAKYHTSNENLTDFKNQKNITQEIIQQAKSGSARVKSPKQIARPELERTLKDFSRSPVINLTDDQAKVVINRDRGSRPVPKAQQDFYKIVGKDFNAEQTLNLAYSFKRLNSSLLITKLSFKESPTRPGYFDSEIGLTNLYIPPIAGLLPPPGAEPQPRRRSKSSRRR